MITIRIVCGIIWLIIFIGISIFIYDKWFKDSSFIKVVFAGSVVGAVLGLVSSFIVIKLYELLVNWYFHSLLN